MNTITILAMLAFLSGVASLSISGFTVINTVVAQMTGDNATMSGNMTAEEATSLANVTVTQMEQAESEEEIEEEAGLLNNTGGNATGGNTTGFIPQVDTPSGPDRG